MKILQTDAGFLTHYEVLSTVVGQLDKYSNGGYTKDRGDTSPAPFLQKVANGLALNETLLRQSKETIASFLKTPTLNALTVKEKLFVANECPTTVVELYLLVERCDERFSMEESAVLLAEIQNHLYLPENNPELSMAKTKARDPKSKGHGHSMYGGERQRGGRGGRGGGRSGGRGGHSGGRGGGGGGRGRGGRGGGNH